MKYLLLLPALFWSLMLGAYESPGTFEGNDSEIKALVFLSSFCPCSDSHVSHLNDLSAKHPNVKIFGVITDIIDKDSEARVNEYYQSKGFKFPIIKDEKQILIKKYKALKTPHSVILKKQSSGPYRVLYEGGVSDHRQFDQAKKHFLKDNLKALSEGKPLTHRQGISLGCYIRRL